MNPNGWQRKFYREARAHGLGAVRALSYARTRDRFDDEQNAGRARLVAVPDECVDIDDLLGPAPMQGDNARAVVAGQKRERERIEREGVSGILAQIVRPGCEDRANVERDGPDSPLWETVDSLFGIVGWDPVREVEYDYSDDLRAAALARLDERDSEAAAVADDARTVDSFLAQCAATATGRAAAAAFERLRQRFDFDNGGAA